MQAALGRGTESWRCMLLDTTVPQPTQSSTMVAVAGVQLRLALRSAVVHNDNTSSSACLTIASPWPTVEKASESLPNRGCSSCRRVDDLSGRDEATCNERRRRSWTRPWRQGALAHLCGARTTPAWAMHLSRLVSSTMSSVWHGRRYNRAQALVFPARLTFPVSLLCLPPTGLIALSQTRDPAPKDHVWPLPCLVTRPVAHLTTLHPLLSLRQPCLLAVCKSLAAEIADTHLLHLCWPAWPSSRDQRRPPP
jgi:hypothetical protein